MNNTTTRTLALVAVFMAATLVVGTFATTTTIGTTQSAFAYPQKKDNGKGVMEWQWQHNYHPEMQTSSDQKVDLITTKGKNVKT